ncbi:MAG: penicillin-insensitive murein endopeptidase [Rhizobiaceae bacterium]|nr:penicillin-insensitive murein endopeptidase [Rhizobiaceae bacterium]
MRIYQTFITFGLLLALVLPLMPAPAHSAPAAKRLFGAKTLPADLKPVAHGFYSKGCIAGAKAIPIDGPNWQVMRLSRNRRWGHPDLIKVIEELSYKAKDDGWNGLLVGDISQPRGGPMLTGHRSHQMGLDADIWLRPMPDTRWNYKQRENISAISALKKGTVYVDKARWKRATTMLLYHAASFPNVERILVHPGIKKQLCDTVRGDRQWLNKIRPYWGHHYHFHLRIACPAGSTGCRKQKSTGTDLGCGSSLDWWFKVAFGPKKKKKKRKTTKKKKKTKVKKRRQIKLADLPQACSTVLNARSVAKSNSEYQTQETAFISPDITVPKYSMASALKSQPIEKSRKKSNSVTNAALELNVKAIAIPKRRPIR